MLSKSRQSADHMGTSVFVSEGLRLDVALVNAELYTHCLRMLVYMANLLPAVSAMHSCCTSGCIQMGVKRAISIYDSRHGEMEAHLYLST